MKKCYTIVLFSILNFSFFISFSQNPWIQKATFGGVGRHLPFGMNIGSRGYVGGGWDGVTSYYDFWEYDPATNTWTQKANCPVLMWSNPAFGIDSFGYVACANNTWCYKPADNTWTIVNNAAPSGTYMEEVKFLINGKEYTIDQDYIYEFEPQTFSWTIVFTLPVSNFACDAGFTIGNKAYLIDNYYQKFYQYDPAMNTFIQKTTCPRAMTVGTSFGLNGKGYVGLGVVNTQMGSLAEMYEYDATLDQWKRINDFAGTARRKATGFVIGNRAYIACGSSGINMQDLWEFNPAYATGIEEAENNLSVTVYPNPMVGFATIVIASEAKQSHPDFVFELFDMQGKQVRNFKLQTTNYKLERGDLSGGTYIYKITSENKTLASGKLIIQ